MNFNAKIKKICKYLMVTYNELFGKIKIDKLKILYETDKDKFIKMFFENISLESYFEKLVTEDRDFLKDYSPQVQNLIEHRIYFSDDLSESYFAWADRIFDPKDFTIDDILDFVRVLQYPPLPLRRVYFDEEDLRDKKHMLIKLTNESSYKFLNSGELFCDLIISGNMKGDFRLWTKSGLEYHVHSAVVSSYIVFAKFIADGNYFAEIKTENDNLLIPLIKFLYGQRINIEVEEAIELHSIADYLELTSLMQICTLIANDTNFELEYYYKKIEDQIFKWFRLVIRRTRGIKTNGIIEACNEEVIKPLEDYDAKTVIELLNKLRKDLIVIIGEDSDSDADDIFDNEDLNEIINQLKKLENKE